MSETLECDSQDIWLTQLESYLLARALAPSLVTVSSMMCSGSDRCACLGLIADPCVKKFQLSIIICRYFPRSREKGSLQSAERSKISVNIEESAIIDIAEQWLRSIIRVRWKIIQIITR